MSDTVYWMTLALALALASYSVRYVVESEGNRARKGLVLVCSAVLGVLLGGWALGWDSWPAGMIAGLAVVELGPAVLRWARGRLARDGADR